MSFLVPKLNLVHRLSNFVVNLVLQLSLVSLVRSAKLSIVASFDSHLYIRAKNKILKRTVCESTKSQMPRTRLRETQ